MDVLEYKARADGTKRKTPEQLSSGVWQGREESNPQPLDLESSALPIELRPFGCAMMIAEHEGFVKASSVPCSGIVWA